MYNKACFGCSSRGRIVTHNLICYLVQYQDMHFGPDAENFGP